MKQISSKKIRFVRLQFLQIFSISFMSLDELVCTIFTSCFFIDLYLREGLNFFRVYVSIFYEMVINSNAMVTIFQLKT